VTLTGPAERTVHTDSDGRFSVQVPPGPYQASLEEGTLPANFRLTSPADTAISVDADSAPQIRFGATETRRIRYAPTATFEFSPTQPHTDSEVRFDASASDDVDGEIIDYEWDFDADGNPDATGVVVSHRFEKPGTHAVTLTVTDSDDNQDSVTQEIEIHEANGSDS